MANNTVRIVITGDGKSAEQTMNRLATATTKAAGSMNTLGTKAKTAEAKMASAGTSTASLGKKVLSLKSAVLSLASAAVIRQIGQSMDQYTLLENQLKLVADAHGELETSMEKTYAIAAATRNGWAGTADIYARLERSTRDLNYSQNDLLGVTEAINMAVSISGTSAQAAEAALFQLGQGLGAGALRGEELNSVLEQTPRLAQAIADGLGVTIAQLRDMGAKGELTAQKVVEAIRKEQAVLRDEFSKTTPTMQQGWVRLGDAATKFFGILDDKVGVTAAMATTMSHLAKGIDAVSESMDKIGQATGSGAGMQKMVDAAAGVTALDEQIRQRQERNLPYQHLVARKQMAEGKLALYSQSYGPLYASEAGAKRAGRYQDAELDAYNEALAKNRPSASPGSAGSVKSSGSSSPPKSLAPMTPYEESRYWTSQLYGGGSITDKAAQRRGDSEDAEIQAYNEALAQTALAQADVNNVTDLWLTKEEEAQAARERGEQQLYDMQLAQETWTDSAIDGLEAYAETAGYTADNIQAAFTNGFKGMENALVEFVKTGKISFTDLTDSIVSDLIRMQVQSSITKPLASAAGDALSSIGTSVGNWLMSAQGNVFTGPDIHSYSNKVVDAPTFFSGRHIKAYASGGNVMGEAGPEAVMPLTRTPSGDLGVKAQGSAGSTQIVYNIDARGAKPGVEETIIAALKSLDANLESRAVRAVATEANKGGSFAKTVGRRR